MIDLKKLELWFVVGSQELYGDEALRKIEQNAAKVTSALDNASAIPVRICFKGILTTSGEITKLCKEASSDDRVVGLICWMHTFSPAKMWINGLKRITKPILHLHTQFNQEIPWESIDMDYINLHQSAHGGREFGFIGSRLDIRRKVVVGHWSEDEVQYKIGVWTRAACGWSEMQSMRIARFGDNMRDVAVTEGDKVEAQIRFGFEVNGYGMGDLVACVKSATEKEIDSLIQQYLTLYDIVSELRPEGERYQELRDAASIEVGLRNFLNEGKFSAFTDTFENLKGLKQLPGIAVQRLMNEGYGFGAEGDWKAAALVRVIKVMSAGLDGGTSFMEDYTYHFGPKSELVMGSHMLEICPSLSKGKPSCEIHPLSIGGKSDPVRLVFDSKAGHALNISLIDLGSRFRLLVNKVESVEIEQKLPKLPVARVFWKPLPDLKNAASAWILSGGSHHTCYSLSLDISHIEDFAEMAGVELIVIDEETNVRQLKKELLWNERVFD